MTTDTKTGKTTDTTDKYTPSAIEGKWYEHWLSEGFFHSEPNDKEPYTVVIPPPNVTGILHMGHILNNTIQDVLVRRARMQGKNACWVPGTDHASIATEAKVVARLREKGIEKNSLTREEFLRHAWEWTEEHGGIILKQLRRLGASCDWERTAFTMDEARSESVLRVFVDLYNKGRIYRGVRMVHWDPAAQTALSDEEVVYKEMQGKLYYLRYKVVGSDDFVVVATTRPETILGDTGLCVNPNDERYTLLHGKRVVVPLVGREVPVIADDYVDMEFGTGALKVTPAHDVNDYMLGEKFGLEAIDIFTDDGRIRPGLMYEGMDRFELRKVIEGDLAAAGLLDHVEPYTNNVGCSERTGVPIEPKLSMQWWLRMEELAKPALDAVLDGDVRFHPDKFRNTYRHWMEHIKDWCISRQLWWGHRIPAWFLPGGGFVVALTEEEALSQARLQNPALVLSDLKQSDDVLDTWFSSWLWPISVFDGIRRPDNEDINYYYPTNDLVTAPEIIFFWVARMVMTGYEYRNAKPFSNVYFTGIVRDKQGRKMSKQLGNSPDPLDLIAIYGADGVRMGMMLSTSAGNDVMFDESMCEQGRNFGNKIWNAWRLVSSWTVSDVSEQPVSARLALEWFEACLSRTVVEMERSFASYHISEALMTAYKLFWDDFSAWLLEMVKPGFGQPIDRATFDAVRSIFERLLQILHPFMPFITEEIWHSVRPRAARESIMVSLAPVAGEFDSAVLDEFDRFAETVASVRAIRQKNGIAFKEQLVLRVVPDENYSVRFEPLLMKMGGLSSVEHVAEIPSPSATFIVKTTLFGVPLAAADSAEQLESLRRDLKYQEGFLRSVEGKLGNERFVAGAPEAVVANERAKQADALAKIAALKEQIALLL